MDDRLSFTVEWYDQHAALIRKYQLIYHSIDKTCEMIDLKTNRLFLKRSRCPNIEVSDLFIGSVLTILGRQLTIAEFGDEFTRSKLKSKMEKTIGIIMPDCVDKVGVVLEKIISEGFSIGNLRMITLTQREAEVLYPCSEDSHFIAYITEGPIIVFELVGERAVQKWNDLIGQVDPTEGRKGSGSSLRAQYGRDEIRNGFHGSCDGETAIREREFFFGTKKHGRSTARCSNNTTLCLVKPHAIKEGLLGVVVSDIVSSGFDITAMGIFNLEKANVEEFYEIYKGVVREYTQMVEELSSGSCVAIEIYNHTHQAQQSFRELVGPSDPEIARHLRPNTLRAKYGKTRVSNAIHCTDLPEDQVLEVEYFFKILDQS